MDEDIYKRISKKLSAIDKLQRYAVRTFRQLLFHSFLAILISIFIGSLLINRVTISSNNFVIIISSASAASGVLLAITLALVTFFTRHVTDWRDRLILKLKEDQVRLASQMEKSAKYYPEISERLTELYLLSVTYIPGQAIDSEEVRSADKIFHDWAKEKAQKSTKKFNFGNLKTYESFEKHLFDAHLQSKELSQTLTQLQVVEVAGRSITTFSPLIVTWVIVVIYTLMFAIIGSMSIIPEIWNLTILLIPVYLFMVSIFALTKDINAILNHMRILETGYKIAIDDLVSTKK